MKKGLSTLLFFFFTYLSYGQLSVAVSAGSDTIKFGDEIQFTYKLNVPEGVDVTSLDFTPLKECLNLVYQQSPTELDSIMDIDVIDGGVFKIDNNNLIATKERLNGPIPLTGVIRARVSSIGVLDLPKPIIGHLSGVQEISLASSRLFVKPIGTLEDLNPDWDIIEEKGSWKDYLYLIYLLIGVAVFLLGLYFIVPLLRKGEEGLESQEPEIRLPADVIAIRDLNLLKEKELWQKGEVKDYHTELTRIMRQYIEDRYKIQALEMTSSQLKIEMNRQEVNADIVSRFDEILQIADKVKFAKGDAGPEINEQFMDESFKIVEETKEIIIAEEEEK